MKGQRTVIWKKEEYSYEGAHGFIPVMVSYMHEDDKIHPAMIVVPGGGYRQVSRTEAQIHYNLPRKNPWQPDVLLS
ncbi:hypothetical protein PZH38_14745, partial [[Ruminococcus] lactaris]|nr:hypothetical protein [[Ruminococcus] lactaris]